LKGKTEEVSPLDLKAREDLAALLAQVEAGLAT
jgi:hypothetical protein